MRNERMDILKQDHKEANFFGKPLVRWFILIAATLTDISLMYSLLTDQMRQQAAVIWIVTIVLGGALAILPVLIAVESHKLYYGITKQRILFVVALTGFLVFVSIMAWVRISTRDTEFTAAALSEFGAASAPFGQESNPGALPLACMLAFLPLVLATINFLIGWNFENPISRRIKQSERTVTLLNERITQNEALCAAYTADLDYRARMLAQEREKYDTALGKIDAMKEYYKSYVRERIAEHLGDPGATSELADVRGAAQIENGGEAA